MSPPTHQFCLKWNNHSNNLLKVFGRLFSNESFTDVTLAAEGRSIRAHKMVLSACSTYFEQLFLEHPEPNPIVIMRETSFIDLAIIVEFMYKGEINVSQEQLGSLLRTAESLRVKGLAQTTTGNGETGDGNGTEGHSTTSPAPSSQQQAAFSPPTGSNHPPPALLPLVINTANSTTPMEPGRDSPSPKRKRVRSKIEIAAATLAEHSNSASSPSPSTPFTPRIENVITVGSSRIEFQEASISCDRDPGAALDLRLTESENVSESSTTPRIDIRNCFINDSEPLRKVQQEKNEPHCYFRGYAVYKFNDYIAHGTRQQYWEESFTKAVMEGIQDRELDLKKGAELLGVSYSTLYGRYRESHGYLRHAWTRSRDRSGGEWWESDQQDLNERLKRENGTTIPDGLTAEELVVEVDSYDVIHDDISEKERSADAKESLILSIRHEL